MELHVEIENTYINVIKFGEGSKNLAIIAGVGLTDLEGMGDSLEKALNVFSKDFTVYVFDRRKKVPEDFSMVQMADDVYRSLKTLGAESAILYGVSQGGMISQILTLEHPEFVEKLVLCSSCSKVIEPSVTVFNEWITAARNHDVGKVNELFLKYVYSDTFKESIKSQIPILLNRGTAEDCDRFAINVNAMLGFDIFDRISEIRCPVLVICDENDKIMDFHHCQEIVGKLKCKILIYNQFSHAVYDENPDVLNQVANFCR